MSSNTATYTGFEFDVDGFPAIAIINKDLNNREVQSAHPHSVFIELTPDEKIVVEILKEIESLHIDELNMKSGLSSSAMAAATLNLELQGVLLSLPGKVYKLS